MDEIRFNDLDSVDQLDGSVPSALPTIKTQDGGELGEWLMPDPPAAEVKPDDENSLVGDLGRTFVGSAVNATGSMVRGAGKVAQGIEKVGRIAAGQDQYEVDATSVNRADPAADWIQGQGEQIKASRNPENIQAEQDSTPDGSVADPSSWTLGADPSLRGYAMQAANAFGSFAPQLFSAGAGRALGALGGVGQRAGAVITGGVTGAAQGGGGAIEQVRDVFQNLSYDQMYAEMPAFAELVDAGQDPAAAKAKVQADAENYAFAFTAPVSGAGGALTGALFSPAAKAAGGGAISGAISKGAISGLEEGTQEVGEGAATVTGMNKGSGGDNDVLEGSFGNAVQGFIGGMGPGAIHGAIDAKNGDGYLFRSVAQRKAGEGDEVIKLDNGRWAIRKEVPDGAPKDQFADLQTVADERREQEQVPVANRSTAYPDMQNLIAEKSRAAGVDPALMLMKAQIESGFNPSAKAPSSTAGGLFQFLDGTWKQYGQGDKYDPNANIDAGLRFVKDNIAALQKTLGRDPKPYEVYMSHLLGQGGAKAVLTADDSTPLIDIVRGYDSKHADAIVNNNGMKGMTVGQAKAKWDRKATTLYNSFGGAERLSASESGSYPALPSPNSSESIDVDSEGNATSNRAADWYDDPVFDYGTDTQRARRNHPGADNTASMLADAERSDAADESARVQQTESQRQLAGRARYPQLPAPSITVGIDGTASTAADRNNVITQSIDRAELGLTPDVQRAAERHPASPLQTPAETEPSGARRAVDSAAQEMNAVQQAPAQQGETKRPENPVADVAPQVNSESQTALRELPETQPVPDIALPNPKSQAGRKTFTSKAAARKVAEQHGAADVVRRGQRFVVLPREQIQRSEISGRDVSPPNMPTQGPESVAATPAGRDVPVKYRVVDAADLNVSNDDSGNVNEDYPQILQPRDRTRDASQLQVDSIAKNINPTLLGFSANTADGAPVISPEGVVESGNGRTMAVRRAYSQGFESAGKYRQWLQDQGYDVSGMKQPMLVRQRTSEMSDADLIDYTKESNQRTTLKMSASEQAVSDAPMARSIIADYRGGDIGGASNRDFVRRFMAEVGQGDQSEMIDSNGMLNQTGRKRIEAAVMASAYDSPELVNDLFESQDNDIKSIGGALLDASGAWAQLRDSVQQKAVSGEMDITPNVVEAVNIVRQARASGTSVADLANQTDIIKGSISPETQSVLEFFFRGENYTKPRGRDAIVKMMQNYAEAAGTVQPGPDMFGNEPASATDILENINERARQENTASQSGNLFSSRASDGQSASQDGQGSGRSRNSANSGQAGAAQSPAVESSQRSGVSPKPVKSFDPKAKVTKASLESLAASARQSNGSPVDVRAVHSRLDIFEQEGLTVGPNTEGIYFPASKQADGKVKPARIYLVANTLQDNERAQQVLAHELVGHYGMEALLGNKFASVLAEVKRLTAVPDSALKNGKLPPQQVGDPYYATLEAVQDLYPDYSEDNQLREVLARMAEVDMRPAFLERVFGYIRTALRALGVNVRMTYADIKQMVVDSAENLRTNSKDNIASSQLDAVESLKVPPESRAGVNTAEVYKKGHLFRSRAAKAAEKVGGKVERRGDRFYVVAGETDAKQSRSDKTRVDYENRIDELFQENPTAKPQGVKVLDRSDILSLMGFSGSQVHLAENKVVAGLEKHPEMTAKAWKKVPQWLENPAFVFESDTVPGRLVFVAPELFNGNQMIMIAEPDIKQRGNNFSLLLNAYKRNNAQETIKRWVGSGLTRYYDKNKAGNYLTGLQQKMLDAQKEKGLNSNSSQVVDRALKPELQSPGAQQQSSPVVNILNSDDLVNFRSGDAGGRESRTTPAKNDDARLTPAFRRWFGESKVVDSQGNPKVLYHGTNQNFDRFDNTRNGQNTRSASSIAFFFSENAEEAQEYADLAGRTQVADAVNVERKVENLLRQIEQAEKRSNWDEVERLYLELEETELGAINADPSGQNIMPVYLRIENPMTLDMSDSFDGHKVADAIKTARKHGFDGLKLENVYDPVSDRQGGYTTTQWVALKPEQIKSAIGNKGTFDVDSPNIMESRKATPGVRPGEQISAAETILRNNAVKKIGAFQAPESIQQRYRKIRQGLGAKLQQGIFDQFAPLRKLDETAYMQARLSKGTDGAAEALFKHGTVKMQDGALDMDKTNGGLLKVLQNLGGEHDHFFAWIAGNRADALSREWEVTFPNGITERFANQQMAEAEAKQWPGAKAKASSRENLFTEKDIGALKGLNLGKMADGRQRKDVYADALKQFNELQKSVMDVAQDAGLIDPNGRALWESEFYVPFYRVLEEDNSGTFSPGGIGGLVGQYAHKRLKGGTDTLGDLLANTLANWSHLLSASMKNMAATNAIDAAVDPSIGIAQPVAAGTKGSIRIRRKGAEEHYLIEDNAVMEALTALAFTGYNDPIMKGMRKMKHYLTMGVTISPTFRIRNLARDLISAVATNEISKNPLKNLIDGWKGTDSESDTMKSLMAGGGAVRFGTLMDGDNAESAKRLIKMGVKNHQILNTKEKVGRMFGKVYDAYQESGDRAETINRAAIYRQARKDGKSHLQASYLARDLMDFTAGGTFAAIRVLTQVVPFFNARLQGMYKLGRGATENPARFAAVAGAVSLASMALYAAGADDDDYKALPDWVRDTYWVARVPGLNYFVYIPKPFEVGAIGSIAERGMELMMSGGDYTFTDFAKTVGSIAGDQLAMNPIPQAIKPYLESAYNFDSFRGQAIDSPYQEKLQPGERYKTSTSAGAIALGGLLNYSPQRLEHLARGYFGWLGTQALNASDWMARPWMDLAENPRRDLAKVDNVFVLGDFVKEAEPLTSKYIQRFYDMQKDVQQIESSYKDAQASRDLDKMRELAVKDEYKLRNVVKLAARQMTKLNREVKNLENDKDIPMSEKRARLDQLRARRNEIARVVDQRARQ